MLKTKRSRLVTFKDGCLNEEVRNVAKNQIGWNLNIPLYDNVVSANVMFCVVAHIRRRPHMTQERNRWLRIPSNWRGSTCEDIMNFTLWNSIDLGTARHHQASITCCPALCLARSDGTSSHHRRRWLQESKVFMIPKQALAHTQFLFWFAKLTRNPLRIQYPVTRTIVHNCPYCSNAAPPLSLPAFALWQADHLSPGRSPCRWVHLWLPCLSGLVSVHHSNPPGLH